MGRYASQIVRELEKIYTGTSNYEIFDDFLDVTLASLKAIPMNVNLILEDKPLSIDNDTPETQALFRNIDQKYGKKGYERMATAFALLLESTEEFEDALGDAYMSWNISNSRSGQYFTPIALAKMMAMINDPSAELNKRLLEAYLETPTGKMHLLMTGENKERIAEFVSQNPEAVIQFCYDKIKPITVLDPACGSGVMFIAMASACPEWALKYGLVQCYGMDIDQTCVTMAQINLMLYGLGAKIKTVDTLTNDELSALPEPHQSLYKQAKENPETLDEVKSKLNELKQGNLF